MAANCETDGRQSVFKVFQLCETTNKLKLMNVVPFCPDSYQVQEIICQQNNKNSNRFRTRVAKIARHSMGYRLFIDRIGSDTSKWTFFFERKSNNLPIFMIKWQNGQIDCILTEEKYHYIVCFCYYLRKNVDEAECRCSTFHHPKKKLLIGSYKLQNKFPREMSIVHFLLRFWALVYSKRLNETIAWNDMYRGYSLN